MRCFVFDLEGSGHAVVEIWREGRGWLVDLVFGRRSWRWVRYRRCENLKTSRLTTTRSATCTGGDHDGQIFTTSQPFKLASVWQTNEASAAKSLDATDRLFSSLLPNNAQAAMIFHTVATATRPVETVHRGHTASLGPLRPLAWTGSLAPSSAPASKPWRRADKFERPLMLRRRLRQYGAATSMPVSLSRSY